MVEITGITDKNGKTICVGDNVDLFGMIGKTTFECGAYGIGFDKIDWDLIKNKIFGITGCDNKPYFCENDNFVSFWELLWNFNCEDDCCIVVTKIN